jgi:hypothetical protein
MNVGEKNGVKELSDYAQKEDISIDGTKHCGDVGGT